mmetsp:Transcript_13071/g.29094  ORF Transcript_13071/g.29094 Transcript_13071/m.29094 type:complete len:226 (+) Transcript_13071:247-924(+)
MKVARTSTTKELSRRHAHRRRRRALLVHARQLFHRQQWHLVWSRGVEEEEEEDLLLVEGIPVPVEPLPVATTTVARIVGAAGRDRGQSEASSQQQLVSTLSSGSASGRARVRARARKTARRATTVATMNQAMEVLVVAAKVAMVVVVVVANVEGLELEPSTQLPRGRMQRPSLVVVLQPKARSVEVDVEARRGLRLQLVQDPGLPTISRRASPCFDAGTVSLVKS